MGDPRGFLDHPRKPPEKRPVDERRSDWREVYVPSDEDELSTQASRCMGCGVPFCNQGCPLGNLIPDWNGLVHRKQWRQAIDRLHATNNFPEFTGRLCPAPCEGACVEGLYGAPITIKAVENAIIERAFAEGWVQPVLPTRSTGHRIAVIGSGPAGLACAQQLTRAGHDVVVFERDDRIGGLLRYGIPDFKLEKHTIDRRLEQMRAEGTSFRTNTWVGGPEDDPRSLGVAFLRAEFDALVLAAGAPAWRDLPIPGRELDGVHQAMEYLPLANRVQAEDQTTPAIDANGKRVVIIGGGDTGADCLGTAHRQGAIEVHQLEILERPPDVRAEDTPWPMFPRVYRTSPAHEEGGQRMYAANTTRFVGENGRVTALRGHHVQIEERDGRKQFVQVPDTDFELSCDLVLLALGFVGPEPGGLLDQLGVEVDARGNVARDHRWRTSVEGVFCAGDMGRGQSLIVWAIAEGRATASYVDRYLMGDTLLPAPVRPTDRPLGV